jgi:hypothetical protein
VVEGPEADRQDLNHGKGLDRRLRREDPVVDEKDEGSDDQDGEKDKDDPPGARRKVYIGEVDFISPLWTEGLMVLSSRMAALGVRRGSGFSVTHLFFLRPLRSGYFF